METSFDGYGQGFARFLQGGEGGRGGQVNDVRSESWVQGGTAEDEGDGGVL